jgi:hypothetical protein
MWICCKCQEITEDYPNNDVCWRCKSEGDFEEITEEEAEEIINEYL